ncbi:uncharacterized protein LOC110850159 [Folsomia candida]|uniref:uncharacterized protein LOC110850159 n=1 Tax=Folsomia candida TaxID=158441 RepID=UPI000B90A1D7|nr:uncharacterized protein LOC110850159 [Folsomia candida]
MRALLVFLFITVVSSEINMGTKFKLFNPTKADSKTGEIFCNGRTSIVTQTTRSFQDKNCWDFVNFSNSKCIRLSQIIRRPFSVIELQGWDSVQIFESDDCSGEAGLLTKGSDHCVQQKLSPRGQTTNYWKCKVPYFRSIAGYLYSQNSYLDQEIRSCTPMEKKLTLLSIDNTKGADPVQASYTQRVISVYTGRNSTARKGAASDTSDQNGTRYGGELSVRMDTILSVNQTTRLFDRLRFSFLGLSKIDWNAVTIDTILQDKTEPKKVEIPPGIKAKIEQVVGVCGNFKVYTNQFVRQDLYANGTTKAL